MTPEQEWRALILANIEKINVKVDKISEEMTTLKVKVGLFSSLVSSIVTFVAGKIFNN